MSRSEKNICQHCCLWLLLACSWVCVWYDNNRNMYDVCFAVRLQKVLWGAGSSMHLPTFGVGCGHGLPINAFELLMNLSFLSTFSPFAEGVPKFQHLIYHLITTKTLNFRIINPVPNYISMLYIGTYLAPIYDIRWCIPGLLTKAPGSWQLALLICHFYQQGATQLLSSWLLISQFQLVDVVEWWAAKKWEQWTSYVGTLAECR